MFSHWHYVPILRWKLAEQNALRDLFPSSKSRLTPLIEIPELRRVDAGMLTKCASSIALAWGDAPFFFDFGAHSSNVPGEFVGTFFDKARSIGLSAMPTIGLGAGAFYREAVTDVAKSDKRGMCLRVLRGDLVKSNFYQSLTNLVSSVRQEEAQIDLVIDLKIFRAIDSDLNKLLRLIPNVEKWRTLTVVAGAFPKDLTGYSVGQHELQRQEWIAWSAAVRGHDLFRLPTFGDYTILHPHLAIPIPGMNISASIRYTAWDYWVVMRGEGLRNVGGSGYAQYPANAELLTMRDDFSGPWYSAGDRYISEVAIKKDRTGSPTTWLQAGINHHLTFVVDQLNKLFGRGKEK
jgi:hypothetical protein